MGAEGWLLKREGLRQVPSTHIKARPEAYTYNPDA